MRGGGWGLTLASAVLVTGCSAVGGGGGGPQDPPKPVDFPTAFAQVSQDVTNRVTAATTAADPAGACRELAGQPLTDWVSALSGAPDTLAGV